MEMATQIPQVIHYCWFGRGSLPTLAQQCIASWRRHMPHYVIKEWNEENFDVMAIPYIAEAYRLGKYAFVSDYARFWILYHHGGIYFDTDVELLRPVDDLAARGAFLGFECQEGVAADCPHGNVGAGLGMAAPAGHPYFEKMVDYYSRLHFVGWNGKCTGNVVSHATRLIHFDSKQLLPDGAVLVDDLYIYPTDVFCPLNYYTGQLTITHRTRSIHHYMASWKKRATRWQSLLQRLRFVAVRLSLMCTHRLPPTH